MNSKQVILSAIGGLIVLASANVYAATLQTSDIVAREASEGPRGKDRVHTGTHKNSIEADSVILAREITSQRQRQRGKPGNTLDDAGQFILAREASEGPRGGDNERPGDRQRRGGRVMEDTSDMVLARRGADDAPGTERPGDNHRQRRGGRLSTENPGDFVIAREASEGPRGGDNERPGDRQRRGGRNGVSAEDFSQLIIAREASEGPRGRDRVHTGTHA